MTFDPKFNSFRKQAQEQGCENGWDFSGFYTRPDGYKQTTQPLATSLATIITHMQPIIPFAPRFSHYLTQRIDPLTCSISIEKQVESGYLKTIYEVASGEDLLGMYLLRERKNGQIFWQLFEGKIKGESICLEFERQRKDRFLHIPFP